MIVEDSWAPIEAGESNTENQSRQSRWSIRRDCRIKEESWTDLTKLNTNIKSITGA